MSNPSPRTQDTTPALNPCDAPFQQPFAAYLASKYPEPGTQNPAPNAQTKIHLGDYQAKQSSQVRGSRVLLIDKNHSRPWHTPAAILEALHIPAPLGWSRFSKLSPSQATIHVHTD